MADKNQIVMTFHTQYGALSFRKDHPDICTLHPVPRALSSSCGTAAFLDEFSDELMTDHVEAVYIKEEQWKRIR